MAIKWNTTRAEAKLIAEIVERAASRAISTGHNLDRTELMMDLTACHCNGCALDLSGLLGAAPLDFTHDVYGIRRHLDRSTGKLLDCFLPRYAKRQKTAA